MRDLVEIVSRDSGFKDSLGRRAEYVVRYIEPQGIDRRELASFPEHWHAVEWAQQNRLGTPRDAS